MKTIALSLITMLATTLLALPAEAQRYSGRNSKANPAIGHSTTGGGSVGFRNLQRGKGAFPNGAGVRPNYGLSNPYGGSPDINPYTHNGDAPMWPSLNTQLE